MMSKQMMSIKRSEWNIRHHLLTSNNTQVLYLDFLKKSVPNLHFYNEFLKAIGYDPDEVHKLTKLKDKDGKAQVLYTHQLEPIFYAQGNEILFRLWFEGIFLNAEQVSITKEYSVVHEKDVPSLIKIYLGNNKHRRSIYNCNFRHLYRYRVPLCLEIIVYDFDNNCHFVLGNSKVSLHFKCNTTLGTVLFNKSINQSANIFFFPNCDTFKGASDTYNILGFVLIDENKKYVVAENQRNYFCVEITNNDSYIFVHICKNPELLNKAIDSKMVNLFSKPLYACNKIK